MTSTLGMALLGLLAREPLTGYELSRSLKGPIKHFWQVRHSQVYPELAKLEQQALATHALFPQLGKPDQKRFSITPAGRAALAEWLLSPLESMLTRSEMALRAYCVGQADPHAMKQWFAADAARHRERLQAFEAAERELLGQPSAVLQNSKEVVFADYAVLKRGLLFERAQLEWSEWMLGRL